MTKSFRILVCTAAVTSSLILTCGFLFAEENSSGLQLRSDNAPSLHLTNPVTYEVDFSAVVTPPSGATVLKVWMPLPQSDQYQQIDNSELSTFPEVVKPRIAAEQVYGNKFAYFEFLNPLGAQIIRHRFTARVQNVRWNVDPILVQIPDRWPQRLAAYLTPEPITEAERFQELIQSMVPPRGVRATGLFSAMSWIDENLTYAHVDASLRADADHAFTKRQGHCSDYHGLCATMGRALGFPTRVTYGLSLYPKNSPSHCKLEAYLPPYGWVSFDVSETQKMIHAIQSDKSLDAATKEKYEAAARNRLVQGFCENSWLQITQGTNYELVPRAAQPVHVVRTIYAEADGEALPEPDPANQNRREYGWMTVHAYKASEPVSKPFQDLNSLDMQ